MTCDELQLLLDDLVDGGLDSAAEAAVRTHLERCADCAAAHRSLELLRGRVAGLPRSIEPPRDLWPGIEAQIRSRSVVRARFGRSALLAAAAALVIVSTVVAAYYLGRHQGFSSAAAKPATQPALPDVLEASFAEIGVTDYRATRQELLDVLEARRSELSPATMEVVLANLRLIDRAMNQIAEALSEDPGNELLMRQLVSTYRAQITLLERAAILPRDV